METCFITSPIEDFYYTSIRRQPLGLLYIIAAVEDAGHRAYLINGHSTKKKTIPVPQKMNFLEKYIFSKDKRYSFPFKNYYHFGMSFDEIQNRIKKSSAEIYLISSLFTTYHEETEKIISIIKKEKPSSLIVAGGYHASLYPEYFLNSLNVDYVIFGEGEKATVELLEYLKGTRHLSDVSNLIYSHNGEIIFNEVKYEKDIDQIKIPAREHLRDRDFKAYKCRIASLIASRGCPNRCSFCSSRHMWGNMIRKRSIDNIINEIEVCIKKFNIQWFNFEDDNLFSTHKAAEQLLKSLIKLKMKNKIQFSAMNGISIENINEDILKLMKSAGFQEINLSLVTGSHGLQKKIGRPFNTEKFTKIIEESKKLALNTRAYFILGLPEQTKEEINNTIEILNSYNVKVFPSIYYNVNSPVNEWKVQRSSAFYNETEHLNRDDLIYFFNQIVMSQ